MMHICAHCDNFRYVAGDELSDGKCWCVAALRRVERQNHQMSRAERLSNPCITNPIGGEFINLPANESCAKNVHGDCPDYETRKFRRFLHLP